MKIKVGKNKINGFTILICLFIIANYISHIIRYITDNVNMITIVNNNCWMVLLIYFIYKGLKKRAFLTKRSILIFCVLLISTLISQIYGQIYFPSIIYYLSALLVFLLSFFCCAIVKWRINLKAEDVCLILKLVVILGIISVIFAFIHQKDLLINVIRGIDSAKSSWNFYSFFSQRNIYAQYCLISASCCLILYEYTKKNIYAILGFIFAFNIYITDSQTALYSLCFMVAFYFYIKSRHKLLLIALGFFLVLMIYVNFFSDFNFSILSGHFDASSGMDSGSLRVSMWMKGIKYLYQNNALLQGFGDGSAAEFLLQYYDYGSFHNAYMDILFEGGLVRLGLFIGSIIYSVLFVIKKDYSIKNSYISFIMTFCLVYFFESGSSIYLNNYFALTTTLLIILVPRISDLSRGR